MGWRSACMVGSPWYFSHLFERQSRHTSHLFLVEVGNGQGEDDARSPLGHVLGADGSAMRLDDGAHDAESQATAAGGGLARVIGAEEAIEDAWQGFRRDALAAIGDSDIEHIVPLARLDGDGSTGWRMAQGIFAQVREDTH